jgi:hypothetical protein
MVDETVSAYRLLRAIDKGQDAVGFLLKRCEGMFAALSEFSCIASAVVFPLAQEEITIPKERYPPATLTE